jgi:GT2 family glycosyltransferase/Flp pilus assembly protein TadD
MSLEDRCQDGLTSIVILSYNRPESVLDNIRSLYDTIDRPFEVVIFDNGSDRKTTDALKTIEGAHKGNGNGTVRVIYNDENLGCSGGRNEAIKYATGDYIVTMDDDMTYAPGWLDALVERVEQSPDIGAASAKVVYPNGIIQWNGGRIDNEFEGVSKYQPMDFYKEMDSQNLTGEIDCDWICGGATIMKRAVVEQVEHKPADVYRNGYEDYDYALQIRRNGWRIVNCPDSVVFHHHMGYEPRQTADYSKKNPKYVKARKNKKTLSDSIFSFISETGYDLLDEMSESPTFYRANDQRLKGLPKATRARLARQEVRRRGLQARTIDELVAVPKRKAAENMKERLREVYGFTSVDIEEVGVEGIERIIQEYDQSFRNATESYDIQQMAEAIYRALAEMTDHLRRDSENAYKYFDLETGILSTHGMEKVVEAIHQSCVPFHDEADWAITMVASTLVNNEIKYLTVDPMVKVTTSSLRGKSVQHYDLATEAFKSGKFEKAIKLYEKVIESAPHYQWAWYDRAVSLVRIGEFEEARISLKHFLELDPENSLGLELLENIRPKDRLSSAANRDYDTAIESFRQHDYCRALEGLLRVVSESPMSKWVWYDLGATYAKLGRFFEARDMILHSLQIDPENVEAKGLVRSIIDNISEKTHLSERQQEIFDEACLAYRAGDYSTALDRSRVVIKEVPMLEDAWCTLALSEWKLGAKDEARRSLEQLLNLNPNNTTGRELAAAWRVW